jgi:hypothetical protein
MICVNMPVHNTHTQKLKQEVSVAGLKVTIYGGELDCRNESWFAGLCYGDDDVYSVLS